MTETADRDPRRHLAVTEPSPWIARFAGLITPGGPVLDVACGGGRHTRFFLTRGHPVTAVDIDISALDDLGERPDLERLQIDLEDGGPFPFAGRHFAGIIVTNYLYRPMFPALIEAIAPGGVLIMETFALGNERFGRPRNPDHLLRPGELLEAMGGMLRALAYEDLLIEHPKPAAVQRICARKEAKTD